MATSVGSLAPLVLCGPSGVGKSVVIKALRDVFPGRFGFSVSSTTRGPRPGEENGKDYHFTTLKAMQADVDAGKFVEHALVHGNMYGTSRKAVEAVLHDDQVCILDIDTQGAKSLYEQQAFPGTRFVFVHPPSMEVLENRLRGRGTETEEKVLKRLANAKVEIEFARSAGIFDHSFVHDSVAEGKIARGTLGLLPLLKDWFPSLGPLPAEGATITIPANAGGAMAKQVYTLDSVGEEEIEGKVPTTKRARTD